MHLNEPDGLWLLLLVVPLVLLYLIDQRPRRAIVSALWMWQRAALSVTTKTPRWTWLKHLRLILQLLALVALALTASEPTARGRALVEHVAFVLDVSASMQTMGDDKRTRLDAAKLAIGELLANMHPDAETLLITAGSTANVRAPFETDRRRLLERLTSVTVHDVEGRLEPAVELAVDKLRRTAGERLLVVVTDAVLAQPARELLVTEETPLQLVVVGEPISNVAITQLDIRNEPTSVPDVGNTIVLTSVKNYTSAPQRVFLTLRQRNVTDLLASRHVRLDPGQERAVVLHFEATTADQGTGLVVEIAPGDGLAVDDRAFGIVPAVGEHPVTIVSDVPAPWLERALVADDNVELASVARHEFTRAREGELVFYVKHCPATMPEWDFVVIDPPPGPCLSATVGPELNSPDVTHWDEQDPRFRFATMGELRAESARRLEPKLASDALLWSRDAALMLRLDTPTRRGTLVGFDFERSNWPLRASFVVFVRNLVELSRQQHRESTLLTARTGRPLRVKVPNDVDSAAVTLPDGSTDEVAASLGVALLPEASQAGFYYFAWKGADPGSALVAANLTSEAESDPTRDELPDSRNLPKGRSALVRDRDLSPWLAALGLVLLLLDVTYSTARQRKTWRTSARGVVRSGAHR